jgi:hypothetical protein
MMLFNFLDNHTESWSGIYFSGDDIAEEWSNRWGPGAVALRTYMSYTVVNPDHITLNAGHSPMVKGVPGGIFYSPYPPQPDSLIVYGGCPTINDFDVLAASPPLSAVEMEYVRYPQLGPPLGGAVVSQTTMNSLGNNARVLLSGFSYHNICNVRPFVLHRLIHIDRILWWMQHPVDEWIAVGPSPRTNSLVQNYPNPFNPTTTIKYTIKEQAHVSLKIYNVAGQLVKTLVNEVKRPENVRPIEWRGINNAGESVASGVYFYKLATKNFTQTKKMVLLK